MYAVYKNNKVVVSSTSNNNFSLEQLKSHYQQFYGDDIIVTEEYVEVPSQVNNILNLNLPSAEARLALVEDAMNFMLGL